MDKGEMHAVVLTGHGGPEKLVYTKVPIPTPKGDQVLVKVLAASVNNTDLNSRTGWYGAKDNFQQLLQDQSGERKGLGGGAGGVLWGGGGGEVEGAGGAVSFPVIQGVDICGRVVEVGPLVDSSIIGQIVIADIWARRPTDDNHGDFECIGTEWDGGFAEWTLLPLPSLHPILTSSLTHIQLAAIPCAYGTAENMLRKARVSGGDMVLVLGASGGVGTALIQLIQLRHASSIVIVGSEDKALQAKALGAAYAYLRSDPHLEAKLSKNHAITACMDPVCGNSFGMALRVLSVKGRYVSCGAIDDPLVSFDARDLIYKDLELHGATRYTPDVFKAVVKYVEQDLLKPSIAKTFPLQEIKNAQKFFQQKTHFGKVVLIP